MGTSFDDFSSVFAAAHPLIHVFICAECNALGWPPVLSKIPSGFRFTSLPLSLNPKPPRPPSQPIIPSPPSGHQFRASSDPHGNKWGIAALVGSGIGILANNAEGKVMKLREVLQLMAWGIESAAGNGGKAISGGRNVSPRGDNLPFG